MRRKDEPAGGNGKSKMTVMMFQLEGGDETLREGIRTISQAMGNLLGPTRITAPKPAITVPALEVTDSPAAEIQPEASVDSISEETQEAPKRPGPGAAKPRSPKILTLDLKSAKISLKEFCDLKGVGDNDTRRYLAIAFWLKENLNITAVTMDHAYTCYRFLGWQTPADASSPLRAMKQKGWFDKGTERGAYVLNHVGENAVIEMKPGS